MTPETIGRYEITSILGRGGFAVVYLANDPFVKRQVAIKVLPAQFTDTAAMRARFQQEAEIIAALEHPAIVPIYDYGEHKDQPFIVMRYMSGGSLAERISKGPMSTAQTSRILQRIGSALERAHNQGIIHRDLKPGNILFDQYGDAYLSDFGIARLTEASLQLTGGSAIGTPAYMSPEQVYGDRPVDGRSDIYALGVILFEMLTGSIPYEADTPAKLMMKHILEPVPRILTVKPDLPPAYENILERAMAKEPDQRFPKATDFTSAVTLLSPTPPTQQPPPPSQPTQTAPRQTAPKTPVEETVLETPTPREIRPVVEPTKLAPQPTPAASDATQLTTSQPVAVAPAKVGKGRPSWFLPAAIAGGIVGLIVVIAVIAFIASNLFGGTETAESPNDNIQNNNQSESTTSQNENTSAIDIFPVETSAASNVLPEADGVLLPRQVGNFHEIARLGRGFLTSLAVSPDGTLLAAGGGIGVWIYDLSTLEPVTLLEGHTAPVRAVAWSPDGAFLASAGDDNLLKIWETATGQEVRLLEGTTAPISTVAWSADGRFLASGGLENVIRIWDAENGRLIQTIDAHDGPIRMVSWHPSDSNVLVSASEDGTVKDWFYPNSRLNMTIPHNNIVEAAVWTNDGSRLITGDDDGLVHVWDMTNGEPIVEWTAHEADIITMALSPDGNHLATTGNDGFLRIWNPDTGDELASFTADSYNPFVPAWLPDNENLAIVFDNNWLGTWHVGNPEESKVIRAHTGPVSSIAWTPEGRGIVSGHPDEDMTFLWNLETTSRVAVLPGFTGDAKSISISADGHFFARPNVGIDVFELTDGLNENLTPIFSGPGESYVNVAELSPDATRIGTVNYSDVLQIWDFESGELLVEVMGAGAGAMAWSPDGTVIATSSSEEPVIVLWNSDTGEALHVIPYESNSEITGLKWSPDGRFLAASDTEGMVQVWERETLGLSLSFQSRGTSLNSLDWSPDGRWLAAGSWSGSIYVWDATNQAGPEPVLYIDLAHLAPVVAIAWSPDSRALASGSHDGTIRVWGAPN